MPIEKTINARELAEIAQYPVASMSPAAIRKAAERTRKRFNIEPLQGAPKGYRYRLEEAIEKLTPRPISQLSR